MTYSNNGVQFTTVKELGKVAGLNANNNYRYAGSAYTYDDNDNPTGPKYLINCIDIDWNSGKVSQATSKAVSTAITTTGELLGVIRGLADRITALENAMVTVSNGLVASLS